MISIKRLAGRVSAILLLGFIKKQLELILGRLYLTSRNEVLCVVPTNGHINVYNYILYALDGVNCSLIEENQFW